MDEEHFGIAVAEIVKAGAIPFVPNDGGQIEIVKENQNLVYNNKKEAVEKITNILKSPSLQKNLHEEIREHGKNFSEKKFKEEIKKIVEDFIKNNSC
jgi:glycosyltransferase involved in cell wall biosynthesis